MNPDKEYQIPLLSFGLWRRKEQWRSFFVSANKVNFSENYTYVIGWGSKKSGKRAEHIASRSPHKKALLLEDGFIRSMGLGVSGAPALSLVVDDLGIYYDASKPSRLEQIILTGSADVGRLDLNAGKRALALVRKHKLTKYNHTPERWPSHLRQNRGKEQLLIVDQTAGDLSLRDGGATAETFQQMLQSALKEYPDAEIWIKTHPDVLAGKKAGHFSPNLPNTAPYKNVRFIAEDIHPHTLIERMDTIFVATSQMGFEALLYNKKVITFGLPWYAGWGLTEDRHPNISKLKNAGRRRNATLLELFTASYLHYCRYINPFTEERGTIFNVIDYLIMMKAREKQLQGEIWVPGLSWWKRRIIRPFIKTEGNRLRFFRSAKALQQAYTAYEAENAQNHINSTNHPNHTDHTPPNIRLLLWGTQNSELTEWAKEKALPILRMEDGFIRSVGLGSNLVPPKSLVIDDLGIYYDATQPSRLEEILQNHPFSKEELKEARALITALVENNIAKYNVGSAEQHGQSSLPGGESSQKVILVPGQVEDDASIQKGAGEIRQNLALLKAVRKANPTAYIIYKPHPDVVSGNRVGEIPTTKAKQYANEVTPEADILTLIQRCDEVHTITSLTGMEALLRGKKVTCYGTPFYAGWGLTEDKTPNQRRTRKLTLEELVAGAFIRYPTYLNTDTGKITNAMETLKQIAKEKAQQGHHKLKTTYLERKWQQLKGLIRTARW